MHCSFGSPSMRLALAGKDSAPVAFAGFAALLAPAAPPPFVGLGADRRVAMAATAPCDPDRDPDPDHDTNPHPDCQP